MLRHSSRIKRLCRGKYKNNTPLKGKILESEIIQNGLNLMLYGMGMVFVFLTVLIICTTYMSQIILKFFPEPLPAELPRSSAPVSHSVDKATLAAIQAAINEHRNARS